MDFKEKKRIDLEDTSNDDNIYSDYATDTDESEISNNTITSEKTSFLDDNTVLTKRSKASRLLLFGFYMLLIIVGAIVYFMLRSNKYEFYLKKDSVSIDVGSSYQIELTPKNVRYFDYLNYNYSVADESVAKVDEYGTVTAVGHGTTTLKISLKPGFINTKTMKIVTENTNINELSIGYMDDNKVLQADYLSLEANQSITLKTIVNGNDNLNISAIYTSSDPSIVTVDSFGNVTAVGSGTAEITAKINDIEGSITVVVGEKDEPIDNPPTTPTPTVKPTTPSPSGKVSLGIANQTTKYVGETLQLTAKVNNVAVSNVKWSSSNTSVATISSKGLIKCNKTGTTVITAEVNGVKGTATIIVKNKPTATSTPKPTATSSTTAPSGTQFKASELQLGKTSLTVNKGGTATFTIKMDGATGLVEVTSSDGSIASLTLPKGSDNMPICNQSKNICFLDGLTSVNEITITVNGVKKGTTYINVKASDVQTVAGNTVSGTGKVGILVK